MAEGGDVVGVRFSGAFWEVPMDGVRFTHRQDDLELKHDHVLFTVELIAFREGRVGVESGLGGSEAR